MPTGNPSPATMDERVTRALADAEIHHAGAGLRALTAQVLTHLDATQTHALADEDIEELSVDLAHDANLDTAALLHLIAETPALGEGRCPPAANALARVTELDASYDELPSALTWCMLCSLIEWLIRDETYRRGLDSLGLLETQDDQQARAALAPALRPTGAAS
jgi:hypothetical protein